MRNKIYLKRKLKIILKEKNSKNSKRVLATFLINVESLGFTFSKDIIKILKKYSVTDLERFHKQFIKVLQEAVGFKKYKPMYPNFPQQVMEMEDAELYLNAIIHYLTTELPEYKAGKRKKLKERPKLKVIELGNIDDFFSILKNLMNAKVAFSEPDRDDLEWFIKQYGGLVSPYFPEKIENKENLAFIISVLKDEDLLSDEFITKYFKTATDVLRFATSLSGGDVSLASNTKFRKFNRSTRKLLLRMLENCSSLEEDMLRYRNKWIRVGEILHPSEYSNRYPKCAEAFRKARNSIKVMTFNSILENYVKTKGTTGLEEQLAITLLKTRPGEFARKLDWVLREFKVNRVLDAFNEVVDKVSTTVLLQVLTHFKHRNTSEYRAFFPKGNISKVQLIDNKLPVMQPFCCEAVIDMCSEALKHRFSKEESLGKVYLDSKLKKYPIPFALRSASKALRTVTRGSRIKMDKGSTVRMFLWWKNIERERVDLDLSAVMYRDNWDYMEHVSYTNLKSDKYQSYHSGDIVNAPKGASEFIDVDIESAVNHGARYIVMNVLSYTGQSFVSLPECFAGCMIRKNSKSGEIYEPKTVTNKFDLTSDNKMCIPLIFDLKNREVVWTDLGLSKNPLWNCVENKQTGITSVGKAITNLKKPNLYDLFALHGSARGTFVSDKKKADIIFSTDEGVTPFDIDEIVSKYL